MKEYKELDARSMERAHKRMDWLLTFMIVRFKFVHQILGMMHKISDPKVGTMGVRVTQSGKFELYYNPNFVECLDDAELTYVFYHEILHLALHHCTTRKFSDHQIGNIAHDLAVNELIPVISDACTPPKMGKEACGCFVAEMKKEPWGKGLQERQSAEWYYDYLREHMPQIKIEISGGGGPAGKDGQGKDSQDGDGPSIKIKTFDEHGGWKEHEIADERVRDKIREISNNDLWGDVSQTVKETILAAQTRKINWRNRLRTWFGNQAWKDKTVTRKRPNRRTGWVHPGSKREFVDRWLVGADTSGSIDKDLLGEWIGVLNQLSEQMPIDFMQFDCDKTEDPHPYDRRRKELEFKGRGGTDFGPVFKIVEERKYKGVMILTDGCAEAPDKPRSARVLWVLPKGCTPPVDWGDRIHLERHV